MTRPALSTPSLLTVFLTAVTLFVVLALAARPGHDALRLALIGWR
ncbi:hypothetical protein [Deinococcus budaensis]|uniref:Uncharacterized protein n=1 Tax=Deinococcus budaensis TaxID=1665626 RepID=A0A7W8GGE6_9DEIO|nr:hypothetical protein [Deinococcus budaensis]MBB5235125.1 hypothetical protein [Deinococcus budaensis]